jgi:hypothetical protein
MITTPKKSDLVAIILERNSILCAAMRKGTHKPYALHHVTAMSAPCIAQTGSLVQTTLIGTQIADFIRKYKLEHSFISIICTDPLIQEGFATTVTASAQNYLHQNLALPHTQLHTFYLGPYQEKFLHWWHRINYPLIMQVHLLAHKHKLNIVRITSPFPLLLELYKKIRGSTFHPVQLSADLETHGFNITDIFETSVLKNFLYYDPYAHHIDEKKLPLLVSAALYEELEI